MRLIDLPLEDLREAPWNSNSMDEAMLSRLERSIRRFGLVGVLVVRRLPDGAYEVLGGNQRLGALRRLGWATAPCTVVVLDDSESRLLSQALNRIAGEDDLGLRAHMIRDVLNRVTREQVLALLPETSESLNPLASMGQETIASHLAAWQKAQEARLKHLQFQLTSAQLEVVEEALAQVLPSVSPGQDGNPNRRGLALYRLCLAYVERQGALP